VSQTIIHNQITIFGSWVTSQNTWKTWLRSWSSGNLKPESSSRTASRWTQADEAYKVADAGLSGKVCIVMD
jgi:threonine dehydrogenase-like Zn-dependent dehydrogenase